jgi:hypothetical protein
MGRVWLFQKHPSTNPRMSCDKKSPPQVGNTAGGGTSRFWAVTGAPYETYRALWASTSVLIDKKKEPAGCDRAGSRSEEPLRRTLNSSRVVFDSRYIGSIAAMPFCSIHSGSV